MEQTETNTSERSEWNQRSHELVRPVQGRMLAGVAKGIADSFGIAEWIPRVFFFVTAFMGGLGVVLYAACWAFIRSEDEPRSVADRLLSEASSSRSWLGIALIVVAGIIVASNFTFLAGEVVWAAAFLVVGLLLYLGYIPFGGRDGGQAASEAREGVQPMTTDTRRAGVTETNDGDSPTGGSEPPPPPLTATPPDLPSAASRERSILGRLTIGLILLGWGVLALLDNIEVLPLDARPRHYMALAVTILGLGLLVGSTAGRARWLILVAAILVPTLVLSPVFEYDWSGERFDVLVAPAAFDELDESYSIDVGSLVIDLTDLQWTGERVELSATADLGYIEVRIPDGVAIEGSARVDIGRVSGPGVGSFGFRDPSVAFSSPGTEGVVVLDLELDLGNIEVVNR